MSNIIKFPAPIKETCCECDKPATNSVRLVNFDTGELKDRKLFCDDHFPTQYTPQPTA